MHTRKVLQQVYGGRYSRVYAVDTQFWGKCFYCGSIATENDHVPPLCTVEFFDITREPADFFLVPSCNECNLLGGSEPHAYLDIRADYIRGRLRKRYAKQWRQVQMWSREEVEELIAESGETGLHRSIKAIVDSEQDLTQRLQFGGYIFEVRGSRQYMNQLPPTKFSVFGVPFDSFKEALQYGIECYRVKADKLYRYAVEAGGSVEKALSRAFKEQEDLIKNREIEDISKHLSAEHSVSQVWVFRSIKALKKEQPDLSAMELSLIFIERYLS